MDGASVLLGFGIGLVVCGLIVEIQDRRMHRRDRDDK